MSKHECPYCEEKFVRLNDKLIHFHKTHLDNGTDMRRPVSCWSCAKQVHVDATHCSHCGWERSEAHKKGAQNVG